MTFKRLFLSAAVLGLTVTAVPSVAQTKDAPQIKTDKISESLYLLSGRGGNIGVSVGDDGVFVIDDKFAGFGDAIVAQIAAITDEPIRYVINTHYHGDHTGANAEMKDVGATVVAHDNVRKRMGMTFDNKLWGNKVKATSEDRWPTLTFSDTSTFHFNGQAVKVIHTPHAHTDGDSIVYFSNSNVLHMGDNYFNGMFPYVDIDGGGTLQGMIAALTTGLEMSDEATKIIPGHGPIATKTDMTETRDRLVEILERVKKAKEAGTSKKGMIKDGLLSDMKSMAAFIDEEKMIRIAYRSLNSTK